MGIKGFSLQSANAVNIYTCHILRKWRQKTRPWSQFISVSFSEYSGYVTNLEELMLSNLSNIMKSIQRLHLPLHIRLKALEILQ